MSLGKLIWAMILNLIVLPGAGQLATQRKRHGYFFIFLFVLLALSFMASVSAMIHKDLAGIGFGTDVVKSAQILSRQIFENHSLTLRTYAFFLGTIYISSIIDLILSYFED